jgi:hypothetical protein
VDDDSIYTHGRFHSWEEAVQAAKDIVDSCLSEYMRPSMLAEELFSQYQTFGDDPFIVSLSDDKDDEDDEFFSARAYARERCEVLCKQDSRV